jgi:hypothetical protein
MLTLPRSIHSIRCPPLPSIPPMISSTTPDKLAEIIRDTWPNLYRPPANILMQDLHNDSKCVRIPLNGYVDYS